MDRFTLDCRQLDQVDFTQQQPVPLRSGLPTRQLPPTELKALKAATRLGKVFNPILGTLEEIVDIASKPVPATLLAPPKMTRASAIAPIIKFSSSTQLTGALAAAVSLAAGPGFLSSLGVYASTTREIGVFSTLGGGLFFNTPGVAIGEEITLILGTPLDFAGPYFGISVSAGIGAAVGFTVLFSPTMPLSVPFELTLMGISVNLSLVTPTRFPLTIALEVTNTQISGIKF